VKVEWDAQPAACRRWLSDIPLACASEALIARILCVRIAERTVRPEVSYASLTTL